MPVKAFFRRGKSKVYFLPAVAAPATGPTAIEITAGTDLSESIVAIDGFQFTNSPIETPDLATTFNSQIPGPDAAADSSLTFKDDFDDDEVRTALAKDTDGFVVLMPYGNVATKRVEVWPVTSTGFNDQWSLDDTAAQAMCAFAVTAPPNQDATVAA